MSLTGFLILTFLVVAIAQPDGRKRRRDRMARGRTRHTKFYREVLPAEPKQTSRTPRLPFPAPQALPQVEAPAKLTRKDVASALRNLGYAASHSKQAVSNAQGDRFEEILKNALAIVGKKDKRSH